MFSRCSDTSRPLICLYTRLPHLSVRYGRFRFYTHGQTLIIIYRPLYLNRLVFILRKLWDTPLRLLSLVTRWTVLRAVSFPIARLTYCFVRSAEAESRSTPGCFMPCAIAEIHVGGTRYPAPCAFCLWLSTNCGFSFILLKFFGPLLRRTCPPAPWFRQPISVSFPLGIPSVSGYGSLKISGQPYALGVH